MMNKKQINRKQTSVLILMALLLLVSGAVLFRMDQAMMQKKMQARNQAKLDSVAELVRYLDHTHESGVSASAIQQQENVRFMTMSLAEVREESGDIAQRLFSDGAVAQLNGNQVIFPQGVPEYLQKLTREDLLKSVETRLFCSKYLYQLFCSSFSNLHE